MLLRGKQERNKWICASAATSRLAHFHFFLFLLQLKLHSSARFVSAQLGSARSSFASSRQQERMQTIRARSGEKGRAKSKQQVLPEVQPELAHESSGSCFLELPMLMLRHTVCSLFSNRSPLCSSSWLLLLLLA